MFVHTANDLSHFLALNLDLVSATRRPDGILLCGRRFAPSLPALLDREDVAALIHADENLDISVRKQLEQRGLETEYWRWVDKTVQLNLERARPEDIFRQYSIAGNLRERIAKEHPYAQFEEEQIGRILQINPPTIGFSLDPRVNYDTLAGDIDAALSGRNESFDRWLSSELRRQFDQQVKLIQKSPTESPSAPTNILRETDHSRTPSTVPRTQEVSLDTLVGLSDSPVLPVSTSTSTGLGTFLYRPPDAKELEAKREDAVSEEIKITHSALQDRKDLFHDVAEVLRQQKETSLLQLESYLDDNSDSVVIGPGSPGYMIRDLQSMLAELGLDVSVVGTYGPKTREAVKQFQTALHLTPTGLADNKTWKALRNKSAVTDRDLALLYDLLQSLQAKDSYQCGRYDGEFQGTRVSMTLFYTDLLMKLWSFKYKGAAPPIQGFVSETAFDVSPIYWERQRKYNATRYWLGLRADAFNFDQSGNTIDLAPIATRIFDASSSPLLPGKEVPATFSSARFSSWWNDHFEEVANYEPQYHRLNEIMKWSLVLQWMQSSNSPLLSELSGQNIASNIRFDTWIRTTPALRANPELPFLKTKRTAESTECLSLIESDPFYFMEGVYHFSGGVSLAERGQVQQKLKDSASEDHILTLQRRASLDYGASKHDALSNHLVNVDGRVYDVQHAKGIVQIASNAQDLYEGSNSQLVPQNPVEITIQNTQKGLSFDAAVDGAKILSWTASREGNQIRLQMEEGALAQGAHVLEADWSNADRLPSQLGREQIVLDEDRMLIKAKATSDWVLMQPETKTKSPRGTRLLVGADSDSVEFQQLSHREIESLAATYRYGGLVLTPFSKRGDRATLALSKEAPSDQSVPVELKGPFGSLTVLIDDREMPSWRRSDRHLDGRAKSNGRSPTSYGRHGTLCGGRGSTEPRRSLCLHAKNR